MFLVLLLSYHIPCFYCVTWDIIVINLLSLEKTTLIEMLKYNIVLVSVMAKKCTICKTKIQQTFLKKIVGTYIKNEKGKRLPVCFECQQKFKTKKEMLENI